MKFRHLICFFFIFLTNIVFSQDNKTVEKDSIKGSEHELDEVIITSSRTNSRIEKTPTRIEVIGQEELKEENGVKPGNILSLLGDIAGIQMQQVSASSGNTLARVQGLNGRYTQILRDGMPLFGGMSGSFSIMQIPPMDLKQIEIIKGSASTLYGGDAIGGIINLISKNPGFEKDLTLTVNQTTLAETNFNGYFAQRNKKIGFTLFTGQTLQNHLDIDNDGLTDVAQVSSTTVHPKLLFYFSPKSTLTLNYSGIFDRRKGGNEMYFGNFDNSFYHVDRMMNRNSFDGKWKYDFSENSNLIIKGSASIFNQDISTKDYVFNAKQNLLYSEASYFVTTEKMNWVAGVNFNGDFFDDKSPQDLPMAKDYHNTTIGAFVQNTYRPSDQFIIESGFRYDMNSKFGNFALPRISVLYKINSQWSSRISGGFGYKNANTINYIDPETDLAKINKSQQLDAELSRGFNADVNYSKVFSNGLNFTFNQAVFHTLITNPVYDNSAVPTEIALQNASKDLQTFGFQTFSRLEYGKFELYLGYVYTNIKKKYDPVHQELQVTPMHNFSTTLFYEASDAWRFGIESSFIANQLDQDYNKVKNYLLAAAMIQYNYKKLTLVLNGENLFDFRQSRYGKIYSGSVNNPVFDKLWAPIDGRVINLSAKYKIF